VDFFPEGHGYVLTRVLLRNGVTFRLPKSTVQVDKMHAGPGSTPGAGEVGNRIECAHVVSHAEEWAGTLGTSGACRKMVCLGARGNALAEANGVRYFKIPLKLDPGLAA